MTFDWAAVGTALGGLIAWWIRYEVSQRANSRDRERLHSVSTEAIAAQNVMLATQTAILEKQDSKLDIIDGRLAQINGTMGRHDERLSHVEREVDRLRT